MSQITPDKQGRVFAANELVLQGVSAIAALIAGPLADRLLEPVVGSNRWSASELGIILGTEPGSGMALLYVICALAMVSVGCSGFLVPTLKQIVKQADIRQS